jgi:putative flavoprotein involved in K+ transport
VGGEIDVVVVGAGQAGLAVSHELTRADVAHVVLERDTVAASWRGRWDSFCLVTPNDSILLPGGAYDGADPHGYLPRDDVVAHLERYAAGFGAPVRTGVQVRSLRRGGDGTLTLGTDDGAISARAVVVATGAYPRAHRPDWVSSVPERLPVLDAADYRNPSTLPPGGVVVVGSGQTGCQLAEELHLAGRHVVRARAVGSAPDRRARHRSGSRASRRISPTISPVRWSSVTTAGRCSGAGSGQGGRRAGCPSPRCRTRRRSTPSDATTWTCTVSGR